ncbi:MAG: GNAT family N-acetyltransferase [Myxococcales bacterium]
MFPDPIIRKQLRDGTRVLLRAVRPTDRALLAQGFEQFSDESRYRRFFVHKSELSDEDLRYLTEVDGVQHHALGAVTLDDRGQEVPLGIARYVRSAEHPEVAEAAVAVIDAMQGKGLGKLLLHGLSDVAYSHGVRKFHCSVLATNEAIHKVLLELAPNAHVVRSEANVEELELELPAPDTGEPEPPLGPRQRLENLLRLAAQRLVSVRAFSRPGKRTSHDPQPVADAEAMLAEESGARNDDTSRLGDRP